MRSKLRASTARMPSRRWPLAAQFGEEPGALALAGHQHHGLARLAVALRDVPQRRDLARRRMQAMGHWAPGASRFFSVLL